MIISNNNKLNKMNLKTSKSIVNNYIDVETGEIIDVNVQNEKYIAETPEEFAFIYASFWNIAMKANLSKVALNLLMGLIRDYAHGQSFNITKSLRMNLSEITGLSANSFANATRELLTSNLIYRLPEAKRTYRLNHRLVFKGSRQSRKKFLLEMYDYCPEC